jgi:hypothetical protein
VSGDSNDWKPAARWSFGQPPPRHYVKATVCGQARKGHAVTTDWDEVNCPACLEEGPHRRRRSPGNHKGK